MSFLIILATSIVVFVLIRVSVLLLCTLVLKLFKLPGDNTGFNLLISFAFYLMYIQGFMGAIEGVMGHSEITNLEWYLVYTFIGISAMLWCYFSWNFEWKAKPQFAKNDSQMIVKKIIVFLAVMLFAFYQGYIQLDKNFGGSLDEEKEQLIAVTNITIIPGIIALDRVLNQINNCLKNKE